jgi:hypothetical protein
MATKRAEKGAWSGMTIAVLLIVLVAAGMWVALAPYRT